MVVKNLNFFIKNKKGLRTNLSQKRKKLITFLSFQASALFYNNLYNNYFNWYLLRVLYKYDRTYKYNLQSTLLGSNRPRHHMLAYYNSNLCFQRRTLTGSTFKQNSTISFFYSNFFLKDKEMTPFVTPTTTKSFNTLLNYNDTLFNKIYDSSFVYFSWTDFFSPGLFNYSPVRFWFLFSYTPSFIKYKSNWINNAFYDFYLIYFFSKIFTLRLHKTIPSFLLADLKLILVETLSQVKNTEERSKLYLKSLEGIFEGLVFFSSVNINSREQTLFFKGSWLDCLHEDLFNEASKWVLPAKEEIDWSVFQGDLDDWWESLFYIFLSESYIWPFINYSEEDFIKNWKKLIQNQNIDLNRFFFLDYSLKFLRDKPELFFKFFIKQLYQDIWGDFISDKFKYLTRSKHKFNLISKFFLTLNSWVLSGLAGKDRRVLLFRFWFYLILYCRGLFFYWFMMILKPQIFNLPWYREIQHIESLFSTNQSFYKKKVLITLRSDFNKYHSFFSKPFSIIYFWVFFSKNVLSKLFIKKRNELEPDFLFKLENLLKRQPYWAFLYSRKILWKVYIAIFLDFFYYKLYYWFLMILVFSAWWQFFKQKQEYKDKLVFYFFEKEQKYLNLKQQNNFSIFFFFKKSHQKINCYKPYSKTKLNLILNFLISIKRRKKLEIALFWHLPFFKYSFISSQALSNLFYMSLQIFQKFLNLIINLGYEKIINVNITKMTRLVLQNKIDMWAHISPKEIITPGIITNNISFSVNKEQQVFLKSIKGSFLLFSAKLDKVNWVFLIRLCFYYYPLKLFYEFCKKTCIVFFKTIQFLLFIYMVFNSLWIDIKFNIKSYHKLLPNDIIKQKKKERLKLKLRIKSNRLLSRILLFNLNNINCLKKIHLHLKQAQTEFKKAQESFIEFPKIFSLLLVGNIKPNNYFLFFSLCTHCTQYFTTILILVFFFIHRVFWIFRYNWNIWFFFLFLIQIFFLLIIVFSFILILSFFFVGKTLILRQFVGFFLLFQSQLNFFFIKIMLHSYITIRFFFKKSFFNFIKKQERLKNTYKYLLFLKTKNIIFRRYFINIFNILFLYFLNKLFFFRLLVIDVWLYYVQKLGVILKKCYQLFYYIWVCLFIIILSFIVLMYVIKDCFLCIYNLLYKQEFHDFVYWRMIFFFFKTEFKESWVILKEFVFIGTLILRFILMCWGFCIYLIYQIGWRFRIFTSKKENIKKLWTVPTKFRVLRFLDQWVLYFFYRLTQFNFFNFKFFCIWIIFWFYTTITHWFTRFLYICIYFFYWFFFFFSINLKVKSYSNKWSSLFKFFFFKKIYKTINKFITKINRVSTKRQKTNKIYLISLFWLNLYYIFYKFIQIISILANLFFKKSLLMDWKIRDLQELLVFINKNYNFLTFYWSTVLQISADYGDFGWWLPYSDVSLRKTSNKLFLNWRVLFETQLNVYNYLKKQTKNYIEKRYHKDHSYYFSLNKITKPLLRKKPFLNDYIYMPKVEQQIKWKYKDFYLLYKVCQWLGLSFIFETLHQRFKIPISQFFFSHNSIYNQNINLFLFARLQKFKDTFVHMQQQLRYFRDNTKILILDDFGINIRTKLLLQLQALKFSLTPKTKNYYSLNTNFKFSYIFKFNQKINFTTLITLLSLILQFFFWCMFLFSLSCFIFICGIFLFFFISWRIIFLLFYFINFYIKLNILLSFILILLLFILFI